MLIITHEYPGCFSISGAIAVTALDIYPYSNHCPKLFVHVAELAGVVSLKPPPSALSATGLLSRSYLPLVSLRPRIIEPQPVITARKKTVNYCHFSVIVLAIMPPPFTSLNHAVYYYVF